MVTLSDCVRATATITTHIDDYAPLIFFLGAMVVFHAISHQRVTFPLWKLAWGVMTLMAISFALARILFLVIHAYGWHEHGMLEMVRSGFFILGSMAMFCGGVLVWRVFRLGLGAGGATPPVRALDAGRAHPDPSQPGACL